MVDEIKGIRDQVLRTVIAQITQRKDGKTGDKDAEPRMDIWTAKDLIGSVASWAGKGKDEIVQVLCREIGVAIAAVVKEPLQQILENRKLQISFELVPKTPSSNGHGKAKTTRKAKAQKASSKKK